MGKGENDIARENVHYINQGKTDISAKRATTLPRQQNERKFDNITALGSRAQVSWAILKPGQPNIAGSPVSYAGHKFFWTSEI